jgi:CBS domain-containing protein
LCSQEKSISDNVDPGCDRNLPIPLPEVPQRRGLSTVVTGEDKREDGVNSRGGVVLELRELLGGEVQTVTPKTSVVAAATMMEQAGVGSLVVIHDGELTGIFTERDVLRSVADGGEPAVDLVEDWMTPYPDAFLPDMDVREAADWMLASGYRHLPVVEDNELIGMASIKDILWALTSEPAD